MEPAAFDDADNLMRGGRGNRGTALAALDFMAEKKKVGLYLRFAQRAGSGGFYPWRVIDGMLRKR